jgi:hypothetical protein
MPVEAAARSAESMSTTRRKGGLQRPGRCFIYYKGIFVCGPVNVANDVLEMLSKCNNVLVHAIATFNLIVNE